jgi:hypothetical protein
MPAVKLGFFAYPDRTPPVETWLDSAGVTLFDRPPPGRGFDRVGYHKAAFSGCASLASASRTTQATSTMRWNR